VSKSHRVLITGFVLFLLCASTLAQGPGAGVTSSTRNPLQIATLHWYSANRVTRFDVNAPVALAFDGQNMWVTSADTQFTGMSKVIKFRPSDGAVLQTIDLPFSDPTAIAFDGANIWIMSFNAALLTKVRASDGVVLGTFPTGGGISSDKVVFDGRTFG
jgi:hypothetical protein